MIYSLVLLLLQAGLELMVPRTASSLKHHQSTGGPQHGLPAQTGGSRTATKLHR